MFSFVPRCQGLYGSQKYTFTSVATVKLLCWAISSPRSQSASAAEMRRVYEPADSGGQDSRRIFAPHFNQRGKSRVTLH